MSVTETQDKRLLGAAAGRQGPIRGSGTLASLTTEESLVKKLTDMGAISTAGDYYFHIPVGGASLVQITLRTTAISGTVTCTFYRTLSDGVTIKGTATSLTTPSSTQSTTEIATLAGERYGIVKITVAAASSVTFDQAEYSAL